LTFDHAAEKVSDRDSGRSRVANIARQRIPAERLHPKATNWRSLSRSSSRYKAHVQRLAIRRPSGAAGDLPNTPRDGQLGPL